MKGEDWIALPSGHLRPFDPALRELILGGLLPILDDDYDMLFSCKYFYSPNFEYVIVPSKLKRTGRDRIIHHSDHLIAVPND